MTHNTIPHPQPRRDRSKVICDRGIARILFFAGVLAMVLLPGGMLLGPCVLALYRRKIEFPGATEARLRQRGDDFLHAALGRGGDVH